MLQTYQRQQEIPQFKKVLTPSKRSLKEKESSPQIESAYENSENHQLDVVIPQARFNTKPTSSPVRPKAIIIPKNRSRQHSGMFSETEDQIR